jgi:outer membrane autotransporter protein
MKTQQIKVSSRHLDIFSDILATLITILLIIGVSPKGWSADLFWTGTAANPAVAGSGDWVTPQPTGFPQSWSSTPGSSKTGADWLNGSVAHFQGSGGGTATLASDITAAGINFDPGANAFTINTGRSLLTIEGAGIANNSGNTQTIVNNGGLPLVSNGVPVRTSGATVFSNASSAGNATIINNGGAVPGATGFLNTSTAGSATIINNGGAFTGAFGGVTVFGGVAGATGSLSSSGTDTSSAGSATIINNGGTGGGFGGTTEFLARTDGGTARVITNGNGNFDISRLTTPGMSIGSIEGSGNYFLGSKTLTVGGNNLSTTVSGVIQDGGFLPGFFGDGGTGGSLTKVGTGTLKLTGNNTYTGMTTVNAGSLIVDGSIASTQTMVNPGGLLGGNGLLAVPVVLQSPGVSIASPAGSLVNSGIVSPGDPVGTLTVSGNYTQNADGTLRINFAPGEHSLLAVSGQASLAGTLQAIAVGGFKLHVGDNFTILSAKGISGTFGPLQNPFISNTIVRAEVVYLPGAVQLIGTQGSFTEAACNPNSLAVAKALDSAVGNPRAAALIDFLDSQPINKLCGDFQLIAPDQLTSMYNTGISNANVQSGNLNRRMDYIHAGSTGFSAAGFTMNGITPSYSSGLGGPTGAEGKTGPSVIAPIPENRWGVFATGLGEFTHLDSTNGAPGFDLRTGGVTLGADYRVTPNFAIGLTLGYAHTGVDLVNNGNLDVNNLKFGSYATVFCGGFYIDSAVSGGWSEYHSHRTALLGTANGDTEGGDFNILVSGGYDWKKGNLSIGPTASFQYTYVSFNSFTETGSLAPLKFNDQHVDSILSAFGGKAYYDWKIGNILVRPELRLAWQHEYGLSAYPIFASFANGAGSSFTVSGPKIGRDSLLLGAGATILWTDRIATYIYYDGELGRNNYDSHNVTGGIRVTF